MIQDFETNIKNISLEEKKYREKSLNLFEMEGFPNKKLEDWKFTDLKKIITDNFKELSSKKNIIKEEKVELINDFKHNSVFLVNGFLNSYNFKHEDQKKIKIKVFKENLDNKKIINN